MHYRVIVSNCLFSKWFLLFVVISLLLIAFYAPTKTLSSEPLKRALPILLKETNISEGNSIEGSATPTPLPLYYVHSSKCGMPFVDPFATEAKSIYKPQSFEPCTNVSDLVTAIYDIGRQRYVLHIDDAVARGILNSSEIEYNCYYQEVTRDAEHDGYNDLRSRKYFTDGFVVPPHVNALILACHNIANESHVLQVDAYSLIQPSVLLPSKQPENVTEQPRKPSIIMFGIDTMSRINLRRTMPKVFKFLQGNGWYEMQGYNKVADNSFPNLLAILSGYTPQTAAKNVCNTDKKGCLDRFPFIWKYLRNASYVTAYAEDETFINTFNYLKPGFIEQPTDYYMRPFMRAIERNMKSVIKGKTIMHYCIGRRTASSYVYDFGRQFARRFLNERPAWGLFWSSFSHDDFKVPAGLEQNILQYLIDFETDGIMKENIVVFFSDHGFRYGDLLRLSSGFLEERLPMVFIYLPPWFREQYPQYAQALITNRNRLTSNYDLHNTLKHIIELGMPSGAKLPMASDCPKCQSLFYAVDEQRSCSDAGIPEHWCTCEPYKPIADSGWTKRIANGVIKRINDYLVEKNLSSLCQNLTLSYVYKTEFKVPLTDDFQVALPIKDEATYRTKFMVTQKKADFQATLLFNNVTENALLDVETITRTNSYKQTSTCIDDKIAKLYCICI